MASPNVVELTDDNFDAEVIASDVPVLVDFWAEWCGPCRMLAPTIDELADDYAGRVKVGKVDTDSSRKTALRFDIQAIPTILLFKGGELKAKFVSLQQKADLKDAIDGVLD